MNLLPLIPDDDLDGNIAWQSGKAITRATFLSQVLALVEALPADARILNMCADRYAFSVALFAAMAKKSVTVLPNCAAPEHLAKIVFEQGKLLVLGDQSASPIPGQAYLRVNPFLEHKSVVTPSVPLIDFDQSIATVYTSGSTAQPVAHHKTFGRVRMNILAGAQRIWRAAGGACAVVGTPPIRHMFGLENSVLLPIFGGGLLSSELPFFPADVVRCLEDMPSPRLLVITPFHLRKLLEADLTFPKVDVVLSATAPLSRELAAAAEQKFSARMMEIYGSTETGQLAMREPCQDDAWDTLAGVRLQVQGEETVAHGDVYETPQIINDIVELITPSRFRLVDRKANMINVAGKRSSISSLNAVITSLPGVKDASFYFSNRLQSDGADRLAAFVVAPGQNKIELLSKLSEHIDPVFLPRPLIFVDSLPRDGNGKLLASELDALALRHLHHAR